MTAEQIIAKIMKQVQGNTKSKDFKEKHRLGNAFARSGKLSFETLIYYTLQATHKSISINYAQLRESFANKTLPHVSKQAISKARQGISHKAFEEMFRYTVDIYYQKFKDLRLWNGFRIYAVDGSTIQIPESQENVEVFGGNRNNTDKLTPLASVSALYDITNDMLVDVTLNPYRYNERISAKEHMEFIRSPQNSIVIFDRGYPSEELFRYLDSKGILFLTRLPKNFKKLIFLRNDHIFTYPSGKSKTELKLRCLNLTLEDGTKEYLVTNLMADRLDTALFADLYKMRWGIECKYRELKNRLEIENWCGRKPVCIKQEFFAAMFISNITAILKNAADIGIKNNPYNKHLYQTNRSFLLNRVKSKIVFLLNNAPSVCVRFCDVLLAEARRCLSVIRPGRHFGRHRRNDRRRFYTHLKSCL